MGNIEKPLTRLAGGMDDRPVQIVVVQIHDDGAVFEHEPRQQQVVPSDDRVQGRPGRTGSTVHIGARQNH